MALSTLKHCPVCREFCTQKVSALIKHVGLVHATTGTPFRIVCGLGGCRHRFSNYRTYRNHVYAIHSDSDDLNTPEIPPPPISSLVCGDDSDGDDSDGDDSVGDDSDGDDYQLDRVPAKRSSDPLQEAAARFILKTKETHRLTQTVMNSDVTIFSQVMLGSFTMLQPKSWKRLMSIRRSLVAWPHYFKIVQSLASPLKGFRQPTGK